MAAILDVLIDGEALKLTLDLELFPPIEGTTLYLLKEDGTNVNFKVVDGRDGMTESWGIKTKRDGEERRLKIAITEDGFLDVLARCTHVAIDTTVFEIEGGSLTPPTKEYPYFSVLLGPKQDELFDPETAY